MGKPASEAGGTADAALPLSPKTGDDPSGSPQSGVVFPRLLIGRVILISAEVFSGASIQVGLWNPWTWVVTYWLYFAHFFFFTTLAVRTGRTSLPPRLLRAVPQPRLTRQVAARNTADGAIGCAREEKYLLLLAVFLIGFFLIGKCSTPTPFSDFEKSPPDGRFGATRHGERTIYGTLGRAVASSR